MGPGRKLLRLLPVLGVLGGPASAEELPSGGLPGASVEDVLAVARRLSPELAARALDVEAQEARAEIAGSLEDPMLRITSDEIDRTGGPRQNKMIYSLEQDIPLWGKRDLKRDAARAAVDQMKADTRSAEADLVEKVKVAFAQYYEAEQELRTTHDLHRVVHDLARLTRDRYAQNRGSQQEVFRAELETTRIEEELTRLEAARRAASGRLNALLARPLGAPLAEPERLRPLPEADSLDPDALLRRARAGNPAFAAGEAEIGGAESNRRLADRSWYPDVTLGAAAIDRTGNGPNGYMASIGVKLPLQWGLHESLSREAAARIGAAQERLRGLEQQLAGQLADAVAGLASSRRTIDLIRTRHLPQSEALLRSGTAAYGFGKVQLAEVLIAEHDFADIRRQLLGAEFDAQRQLAAIEHIIGGDL